MQFRSFDISGDVCFFRRCALFRVGNRELIPVDSDHAFELVEQRFGEKAGAAISVDQQILIWRDKTHHQIAQVVKALGRLFHFPPELAVLFQREGNSHLSECSTRACYNPK